MRGNPIPTTKRSIRRELGPCEIGQKPETRRSMSSIKPQRGAEMNIILRSFAAACLVLFSLSALGDNNRRSQAFLMFNAGTLTVNIMQLQFSSGAPEPISIIEERSIGTLGRANLKTLSQGTDEIPGPDECPDGFPIQIVTDDATVLTFHDLSQLVGNVRTVVCIDPVGGRQAVRGEGQWSGGTRRFADVTGGEFEISSSAAPQSTNGQFYSTVGVISGRLERH